MAHWRSNIFVRIKREALDAAKTLPSELQAAALLVRGSTPQGRFHIQVTASADPGGNSDAMLFSMIPDIDQLKQTLASQRSGWIAFGFRGVSQHQKTEPIKLGQILIRKTGFLQWFRNYVR